MIAHWFSDIDLFSYNK